MRLPRIRESLDLLVDAEFDMRAATNSDRKSASAMPSVFFIEEFCLVENYRWCR
jgi:hypothetical protein